MKISDDYREAFDSTSEAMLTHTLAVGVDLAQTDMLAGEVRGLPGTFIVTSSGRTRWRGDTLPGALTYHLIRPLPLPVRVWHTTTEGERRLVLIHGSHV